MLIYSTLPLRLILTYFYSSSTVYLLLLLLCPSEYTRGKKDLLHFSGIVRSIIPKCGETLEQTTNKDNTTTGSFTALWTVTSVDTI